MGKAFLISFFLITYITFNSVCDETMKIEEDDHSLLITDSNWDYAHKLHEYILIYFYKPECHQCIISDEIFVYTAKHAKEMDHEVKFAFVDASKEKMIAQLEEIETVPVIRFYRNKTGVDYLNTMSKENLLKWLTERVNYEMKLVNNLEDAKNTLINNQLTVIGCILSNSLEDAKDFEIVSSIHEDLACRLVTNAELCQKLNLPTNENSLGIYDYEFDIQHIVSGKLTKKIMNDFIVKHHVPIYSEFSNFIFTKSFAGHYHYFVPIIFKSLPISINVIKKEIRSIAKELDGKAIFIHFDISKKIPRKFLEHLAIPENEGFRVVESNEHLVNYKPENPLNLNGTYMLSFIRNVMDGSVDPELMKSEPIDNWHKELIKPLTRKTYDQVVLDKTKNVFVIIYAPDCRFSREALDLFDKLGEIYKDSDTVLGKLDSSKDQLPRIKIHSTPMFFLYLKDTNEKIQFLGKRTIDNIKNFIESKGKEGNERQYLEIDHLQHARLTEDGLVHEEL